jgi:hypothetical protein
MPLKSGERAEIRQLRLSEEQPTAEQIMWAYYQTERAKGRMPTGAELDRIVGTNNYGRRVLRRWRRAGRIVEDARVTMTA